MRPSSPARFHEAWYQPLGAELAQCNPAELELAVIGARPSRHLAAIANTGRGGIARQLRKLERGRETLLHRLILVARDRLEPRAPAAHRLGHLAPPLVLLDRTLLRHSGLLGFRV